jgi:hypothetical protein
VGRYWLIVTGTQTGLWYVVAPHQFEACGFEVSDC